MARTPSKEAHEKVLRAALDLIGERGIEGSTMDGIAAASGVSKATVYKHWANKDELLIDVIRQISSGHPSFDSGDPRQDLTNLLRHLSHAVKSEELTRIWPRIISYAVSNPNFGRALQQYAFSPRREQVLRMLVAASEKGGLRADIDPEFAMDLLIGPVMHRRFVDPGNIPEDFAERVVENFWNTFRRDDARRE